MGIALQARMRQGEAMSSDDEITHMQEEIAHLARAVDDLSDTVIRQEREIATLTRRLEMLMQRAAERELEEGGTVPLADQKPPHW